MGESQRRLFAAATSLAIAISGIIGSDAPAMAAPSTTVANEQGSAPASSPTATPTPSLEVSATPTASATPNEAASKEPSAPAASALPAAPDKTYRATPELQSEAVAGASYTAEGPIGEKYSTVSDVLGAPTSEEFSNQRFGGAYQYFERGTIAYLEQYGAYAVIGGINALWQSIGAQDSDLGYPTSDEYAPMAGGVMQNFQFGKISWNPATGSRITKGGIGATWDNAGGPLSGLGYPTTDEYSPVAGGVLQGFQYGKISWTVDTGSRITKGGIGAKWDSVGGPLSGLGYPISDEYPTHSGGVSQDFQSGQIVYSPSTGSRFIRGGVGATWISLGGPNSALGFPTSDEVAGLTGGGAKQSFQSGEIVWSPSYGTKIVAGGIRVWWDGLGAETGRLGYPTSNEYGLSGGRGQDFEGGRILWSGTTRIEYPGDPVPVRSRVNCADFSTQAEAQGWYDLYAPSYGDTSYLDDDMDGIVCEYLP